jgi:hypothetical protein
MDFYFTTTIGAASIITLYFIVNTHFSEASHRCGNRQREVAAFLHLHYGRLAGSSSVETHRMLA